MAEDAKQPTLIGANDYGTRRKLLFDYAVDGINSKFPVENAQFRLRVENLAYDDHDKPFTPKEQREALLGGRSLDKKLKGNWVLEDVKTGQVLDRTSRKTIVNVPWLTDRGTFIRNGSESSIINQFRLIPGVFVKSTEDGRVETHVNVKPGTGHMFKISMEPADPVFEVLVKGRKIKMYPLLKSLGVSDDDMRAAWGDELLEKNKKGDSSRAQTSAFQTFGSFKKIHKTAAEEPVQEATADEAKAVSDSFARMELDPKSVAATLGKPYGNVSPQMLLDATRKMIRLNKGEDQPDDRDSLEFQRVHMAHDFLKERIAKDSGGMIAKMLWKATARKSLDSIPAGALNKHVDALFNSGGMTQYVEEINPLDPYDQAQRVTRLGEGALGDAVPEEARSVQSTFRGYVDPIRTPQSMSAGLDMRMAHGVKIGTDGLMYREMVNAKNGKTEWVDSTKAAASVVGFPEALKAKGDYVPATVRAEGLQYVHKDDVDYVIKDPGELFSTVSNMVPMLAGAKGQRMLMGAAYHLNALPLLNREAPFVRGMLPDGTDAHQALSGAVGVVRADQPGVVESVGKDSIKVKNQDGSLREYHLYNNFPFARKSSLTNIPSVEKGQAVKPGDLIATSNFSNKKGEVSLGLNLRCAYMPYKGYLHEDAIAISESAARKLTSEMMTSEKLRDSEGVETGLSTHMSSFPGAFTEEQRKTIDKDGLVKPGTIVKPGDPLILAVKRQAPTIGSMGRRLTTDHSVVWDHHDTGVVTDARKTKDGWRVQVRSNSATQIGDKLCYAEDTEILTSKGWKNVSDMVLSDAFASLTEDGALEYVEPMALNAFHYEGPMHNVESTQVSLLTTPEHRHLAKTRYQDSFSLVPAEDLFGTRYRLKKDARWTGSSPSFVDMPSYTRKAGQGGRGELYVEGRRLSVEAYMVLLGAFLSEGHCVDNSGNYGLEITQLNEPNRGLLLAKLRELGIRFNEVCEKEKVRIYGKDLMLHFSQFGHSHEKYIPDWVFSCARQDLEILYEWLMWGDGCRGSTGHSYCTTSPRLADDMQRLCLHIGLAATIKRRGASTGTIKGKAYAFRAKYEISIYRRKLEPEINHGHGKRQKGQAERWVDYSGTVYCPSLPRNHTVYVRRNGKTCWSGNCGRHGNKGVVGIVLPDEQMPKDSQGRPLEILLNPYGVGSRTNPAQIIEAALGKVAEKTGRPYILKPFNDEDAPSLVKFAQAELAKAGLKDREDVFDPSMNRNLKDVFVGNIYIHKLQHTAEAKSGGRSFGGYSQDMQPSTGGHDGGKRLGGMECASMFSHGALANLREMKLIKGQENYDYWRDVKLGRTPVMPRSSFIYNKFRAQMRAAGIHLEDRGPKTHMFAMTNAQAKELTQGREVQNTDTYDAKKFTPIAGGLFDEKLTGGAEGNLFASVKLDEPVLNPVMEDSVRRILGVTMKEMEGLASGEIEYKGLRGGKAMKAKLADVNLDMEILKAKNAAKGSTGATRDAAIKKLRAAMSMKEHGAKPVDFMMDTVPVLPPSFRPITSMDGENKAADANYLYRELMFARDDLREAADILPDKDLTEARARVVNAYKSLVGLEDSDNTELSDKKVGGILKTVFGKNSPKAGQWQRRMVGMSQDLTSRAVIAPDPTLRLDQVGLPVNRAWELYEPFVVRRLVRGGMPATQAAKAVADRTQQAEAALQECVKERPVMVNRAPTMHKWSIVGLWPRLIKGDTMRMPNSVLSPLGGDYDGDANQTSICTCILHETVLLLERRHGKQFMEDRKMNSECSIPALTGGSLYMFDIADFPRSEMLAKQERVNGTSVMFHAVEKGIHVVAFDEKTGSPRWAEVSNWSEHHGCPVEIVTLSSRRQIVVDDDPRGIYGFDPLSGTMCRDTPSKAKERRMLVPRVAQLPSAVEASHIDIKECGKVYTYHVNEQIGLTADFGYVLGALCGDGWTSHVKGELTGQFSLCGQDMDVLDAVDHKLGVLFADSKPKTSKTTAKAKKGGDRYGDVIRYTWFSKTVASLLEELLGAGAGNKHLPPFFLNAPREFREGLLAGLMDTDGSIAVSKAKGKPQLLVNFCSTSLRLVREIKFLCLSLDIESRITGFKYRGDRQGWTLSLSACDIWKWKFKYMECRRKLDKAAGVPVNASASVACRNDLVPVIPEAKELIKVLGEKADCSYVGGKCVPASKKHLTLYTAVFKGVKDGYASRNTCLDAMAEAWPDNPTDALAGWRKLVENESITWERITSVVKTGKVEDLYDLTVPGYETFMSVDGVILSNTLSIHVPVTDEAVKETVARMMPNRMLMAARNFKLIYPAGHEYVHGAWIATKPPKAGKPVEFDTPADAKAAFAAGKIDIDTPVVVRRRVGRGAQ